MSNFHESTERNVMLYPADYKPASHRIVEPRQPGQRFPRFSSYFIEDMGKILLALTWIAILVYGVYESQEYNRQRDAYCQRIAAEGLTHEICR